MRISSIDYRSIITWFLFCFLLAPVGAFLVGLLGGYNLLLAAGLAIAAAGVTMIRVIPFSLSTNLLAAYLFLTMAQATTGIVNVESVKGASVGNLAVLGLVGNWFLIGYSRGQFFKPTPFNFWLPVAFLIVPLTMILYTAGFRDIKGYTWLSNLIHLKNICATFLGFFILTQTVERRRDLYGLFTLTLFLFAGLLGYNLLVAVAFQGVAAGRTSGAVHAINTWAAFINEISPYFLMILLLLVHRTFIRVIVLFCLGGMIVSLLLTSSRMGMIGFGFSLCVTLVMAIRAGGKVPIVMPAALGIGVFAVLLNFAPEMIDRAVERFQFSSPEQTATLKSRTLEQRLNKFSGDRLEIWKGAYELFKENPVFGSGYNVIHYRGGEFHRYGKAQAAHSLYVGFLAHGGVTWFGVTAVFFWILWKVVYAGWKWSLREEDLPGQILCGGTIVSILCLLLNGLTSDEIATNARMCVIATLWGIGVTYSLLFTGAAVEAPDSDENPDPDAGGDEHSGARLATAD